MTKGPIAEEYKYASGAPLKPAFTGLFLMYAT